MKLRIIGGVTAAVLLILLLVYGSVPVLMGTVLVAAAIAYLEFDKMFFEKPDVFRQGFLVFLCSATILAMADDFAIGFMAFWISFIALAIAHVLSKEVDFNKSARDLAVKLIGYIYVLSLFGFMIPIVKSFNGREYIFLLFLIVFIGDSTAYFVGKFAGKKKIAPNLSPKKTVEGAIGSVCGATVIALLWLQFFYPDPWDVSFGIKLLAFVPILNVFAQAGDFFESLLKRSQDVKDSGSFIPGHGGILDRLDGLAFSSPLFYFYVTHFLEIGA